MRIKAFQIEYCYQSMKVEHLMYLSIVLISAWLGFGFTAITKQPDPLPDKYLSWVYDLIGHFLVFMSFVIAAWLAYIRKMIGNIKSAPLVEESIIKNRKKYLGKWLVIVFFLCVIFSAFNILYVASWSSNVNHWSREISSIPWLVPSFIAILYYMFYLFPCLALVSEFAIVINTISRFCTKLEIFDLGHHDKGAGLVDLGNAIVMTTCLLSFNWIPVLVVQIFQKGDFTLGNFISLILLFFIFAKLLVIPMLNIHFKLKKKKEEKRKELEKKKEDLAAALQTTKDEFEYKKVEHELKLVDEKIVSIRSLQTVPISIMSKIFAVITSVCALLTAISGTVGAILKMT